MEEGVLNDLLVVSERLVRLGKYILGLRWLVCIKMQVHLSVSNEFDNHVSSQDKFREWEDIGICIRYPDPSRISAVVNQALNIFVSTMINKTHEIL